MFWKNGVMQNMVELIFFITALTRISHGQYNKCIQSIMGEQEEFGAKIENDPLSSIPIKWDGQIQYIDSTKLCRDRWGYLIFQH